MPTTNARGGINKKSNRERLGQVASGSTGDISNLETALSSTEPQQIKPITPQDISAPVDVIDASAASTDVTIPDINVPQMQDQFVEGQQQKVESASTAESASFDAMIENALTAPTEAEIRAGQEEVAGLAEKRFRVNQLQTELVAEKDRLRTIKEQIISQGGGLKMGAAAEIANVERESYAKQADMALVQLAAQDQLQYAQDIVDRSVDAMFSRQERINDVLGAIYERNKSQFDKEEQRLFETKQADRERQLENEKQQETQLQTNKLEALKMAQLNGAPDDVISAIGNARTPQEVFEVGGQYASGDMLDRMYKNAQIANIYDTINARARAAEEASKKAREEEKDVEEAEKKQLEADTEKSLGIRELAQQLAIDEGLPAAVGFGFKKTLIGAVPFVSGEAVAGTARADFEATATRLGNMLTLDNLNLMSGVLSETDIAILESAGSNLKNYDQSEAQYKKEIQRVLDIANRTIKNNGMTEEQAIFWGLIDETDTADINSIYD